MGKITFPQLPPDPLGIALGVLFEPYPVVAGASQTAPSTQTVYGVAVYATAGTTITGIKNRNGVAAAGTNPTAVRFGLADSTGKILALSANYGTGGTNTATTVFALGVNSVPVTTDGGTTKYVTTYSGVYFPCFVCNGVWGTTQPTPVQAGTATGAAMVADGTNPPASFTLGGQTDLPAVNSSVAITAGSTRAYYLPLY